MGQLRTTLGPLVRDGRVDADEGEVLGAAVGQAASPADKAEVGAVTTRYREAFDDAAYDIVRQAARTVGVQVPSRDSRNVLQSLPKVEDFGNTVLSSSQNRRDPRVGPTQHALMLVARAEGRASFGLPGHGADGDFGGESTRGIAAFQASRGIASNPGALDAATLAALRVAVERALGGAPPLESKLTSEYFKGNARLEAVARGELVLSRGARGEDLKPLQEALDAAHYPLVTGIDGSLGRETQYQVASLQRDRGLPETGKVDAATLLALDKLVPTRGAKPTVYPEYDLLVKDGVLYGMVGIGYDETGADLSERYSIRSALSSRGFAKLAVAGKSAQELRAMGLDPARIDTAGTYYIKRRALYGGRETTVVLKYIDRETPNPKQAFAKGMEVSSLPIYGGHARYGSGPDFDTKEATKGNFVIGVNARGHREGSLSPAYDAHMREILKNSPNDLEAARLTNDYQLMFFFGCKTRDYVDELRAIPANKTPDNLDTVTSNDLLYWSDTTRNILVALDGVLAQESANSMQDTLLSRNRVSFTFDGFGGNTYRPSTAPRRADAGDIGPVALPRLGPQGAPAAGEIGFMATGPARSTARSLANIAAAVRDAQPGHLDRIAVTLGEISEEVRDRAVVALRNLDAAKIYAARLADPSTGVAGKELAALVLRHLRDSSTVPALEGALADSSSAVRAAAVQALAVFGAAQATPALTNALSDANPLVRALAVAALGSVRGAAEAAAQEALQARLAVESDDIVREDLQRALSRR